MIQLKVILERGEDQFAAYSEEIEGAYGAGDTVVEAKESFIQAIELIKEFNSSEKIPVVLKQEYELVWKFDTMSLLNYYRGIFTNSALERLTGINQRQLQHYAAGLKTPRPAQAKKIENALHKLGEELLALEL